LKTYLGKKPAQDGNLRRGTVSCYCRDCDYLNTFLQDPKRAVLRFPCSRRYHLHQKLDSRGIDCSHTADRSTNPNTLVIKKTNMQKEEAINAWTERKVEATRQLANFDEGKLKKILGDEYDRIVNFERFEQRDSSRWQPQVPPAPVATPPFPAAPAARPQLGTGWSSGASLPPLPAQSRGRTSGRPKPLQPTPANFFAPQPPARAGSKRTHSEIIDLTGED
jgi:hypothetical protein